MDLDHVDGSGATFDPVGAGITTINAHQPEYAIHLDQTNQEYTPENTKIYAWVANAGAYSDYKTLSSVGGDLYTPDLYGVAYDSATTAWAVGQDGTILYWNGSAWTEASRPSTATLLAVDALSPSFVWAVGNAGTLLKWNGSAWEKKTSPTTKTLWDIHFVSATNGWASASTGSLLYWNGTTWTLKSVTGAGDIYAVDMITSTANSANNFGLAVGSLGTWLKWNPSTKLWENQVTFTSKNLYDVSIVSDTLAWAVGQDGVIFQWNGAAWSNPRNPVPAEPDLNPDQHGE